MAKKLSKEQWERRINEAGAGRYEFLRWLFDDKFGSNHKCVVRCVKDGYAWASKANNLVDGGSGCPKCASNRRFASEERINQINSLDNIEFVYWLNEYKNQKSKAVVRCVLDGFEWSASADNLINNIRGCPQCAGQRRWTAEERIGQINALNNIEFVSWSDVYKGKGSKANVICKVDGFEWNAAVNDLVNGGYGCPKCAKYGYDKSKTGYLYALRSECGRHVKVGISNKPSRRHTELARATPFTFNLIEQISGDGVKISELEKYFHEKYERAGFTGFDGCTEWLICTPQLLDELRELENVK